jgi:hypothetical protein
VIWSSEGSASARRAATGSDKLYVGVGIEVSK